MLVHPAASDPTNISLTCPNVSAAKRKCACPMNSHQLHCMTCKSGGGVHQRHSALARCLEDLITTHTGPRFTSNKVSQVFHALPSLCAQAEGARMDVVFDVLGSTYYIGTDVVTSFSSNAGLISPPPAVAQVTWPNAKRRENVTDTPVSAWSHSSSRPQNNLATTPKKSSNTSTTIRTTTDNYPRRLGDHQEHLVTTASPNKNSEPSPRDHHAHCLTHDTPIHHTPVSKHNHARVSVDTRDSAAFPLVSKCFRFPAMPAPPSLAMYTRYERFPKPAPQVLPLDAFGNTKPGSHGPLSDSRSDLLPAQYRLSILQWNAGVACRQPSQLVTAMCGAFNAALLQKAP